MMYVLVRRTLELGRNVSAIDTQYYVPECVDALLCFSCVFLRM